MLPAAQQPKHRAGDRHHRAPCLRRVSLIRDVFGKEIQIHVHRDSDCGAGWADDLRAIEVHASAGERARKLAGDELIPSPIGIINHAITIHRSPADVWPWLAQRGASRAGWYSYDFIDNGGRHSAERILPEFQNITVGSVFPALPGAKDVFVVAQYEPESSLVLSWRLQEGLYQTTWAFVLEQPQPGQTRLLVRAA